MGIRLNVFCNKQNGTNPKFRELFDKVDWGPGQIQRDELGIPISKPKDSVKEKKEAQNADISK